jgi:secretion/DNA translocation related TadE-like protein
VKRHIADAERGSATVLTLAGFGLVVALTVVVLAVGVASQVRHRAGAAADAAALAAAASALDGGSAACARGADLAALNGARLVSCVVGDGIADVTVSVEPPGMLAVFGLAKARARAGPASAAGH